MRSVRGLCGTAVHRQYYAQHRVRLGLRTLRTPRMQSSKATDAYLAGFAFRTLVAAAWQDRESKHRTQPWARFWAQVERWLIGVARWKHIAVLVSI